MNKKLVMIAIALVIFAIVVALVAAAPAIKKLASPSLLSPKNNAKLTNEDHLVMLEWEPVDDARVTGYLVEVEGYGEPLESWGRFSSVDRITADTSYQLDCFPADYGVIGAWFKYRWRVTALASVAGSNSAPSNWKYFSFPEPEQPVRLATVRLLTPEKNAKFSLGESHTYTWELVPGATGYMLYHQKLNAENVWKMDSPTVIFGPDPDPYVVTHWSNEEGTYRWRVVAHVNYNSYSTSPFRYFTVA